MIYIFDMIDRQREIYSVRVGYFLTEADARRAAQRALSESPKATSVDLWNPARRIAHLERAGVPG